MFLKLIGILIVVFLVMFLIFMIHLQIVNWKSEDELNMKIMFSSLTAYPFVMALVFLVIAIYALLK